MNTALKHTIIAMATAALGYKPPGRACEHRKDGTSGEPAVLCGEPAVSTVHFSCANFSAPMCAEHASATAADESMGGCVIEPLAVVGGAL